LKPVVSAVHPVTVAYPPVLAMCCATSHSQQCPPLRCHFPPCRERAAVPAHTSCLQAVAARLHR
jgi:hypothetical protein